MVAKSTQVRMCTQQHQRHTYHKLKAKQKTARMGAFELVLLLWILKNPQNPNLQRSFCYQCKTIHPVINFYREILRQ
jgi:hypothetical protein